MRIQKTKNRIILTIFLLFFISSCSTDQLDNLSDSKPTDIIDITDSEVASPKPTDIVIIANPVNLSTIAGITKFRSCFGHEFGFTSAFEGKEATSSLKHYFVIIENEYFGKENTIPVYSAFDGIVTHIETDQILIEQKPFNGWVIDFNHVVLKEDLKVGSEVKAGELLGYVNTIDSHALDISLQAKNSSGFKNYDWYNNYESIFNHMSEEVYKEYNGKGINKENIIISKTNRDANPCSCDDTQPPYPNSPYCPFAPIPFSDKDNGIEFK